jgi:hypothetical protein
MKLTFSLVDATGKEYRGSVVLTPCESGPPTTRPKTSAKPATKTSSGISFAGNPRAFMKRLSSGLSGPQKFTLLLAKLAQGDISKTVSLSDIFATWDKMTGILGKSNGAYANRAKDNGWVDSPKAGVYVLCDGWAEILPE